jgi:hypothetical protein
MIATLRKYYPKVSLVKATVSMSIVIIVCKTMPQTHFPSMRATQDKSDVTNGFGDSDFILAVCTCFLRKCGRFEVIRDVRSLKNGGIPFPVDGITAEKNVTSPFNFWLAVYLFTSPAFSIYLSPFKSYSRISCLCNGEHSFSIFGSKYDA